MGCVSLQIETLLWTLDLVNRQQEAEQSFKFGLHIKDDCTNATIGLAESMTFVEGVLNSVINGESAISTLCKTHSPSKYYAVIGGSSSETTLNMASLFKLFSLPQVSCSHGCSFISFIPHG